MIYTNEKLGNIFSNQFVYFPFGPFEFHLTLTNLYVSIFEGHLNFSQFINIATTTFVFLTVLHSASKKIK